MHPGRRVRQIALFAFLLLILFIMYRCCLTAIHLLNSAVLFAGVAFVLADHMHPVIECPVRAATQQSAADQGTSPKKPHDDSFHRTLQGLGMKIWE